MNADLITTENISKADIHAFADSILLKNDLGEIDPLRTYLKVKAYEAAIKKIIEGLQESARTEAVKYGAKTFETMGAEITLKTSGDTLNYEADAEYKLLKDQLKEREEHLKTAFKVKGEYLVDGELIPRVPVKTHGKETLSVSFK